MRIYVWVWTVLNDSSCVIHFPWASCYVCGCWKIDGSTTTPVYLLHRQCTAALNTISFNLPDTPTIISVSPLQFTSVTSRTFPFRSIDSVSFVGVGRCGFKTAPHSFAIGKTNIEDKVWTSIQHFSEHLINAKANSEFFSLPVHYVNCMEIRKSPTSHAFLKCLATKQIVDSSVALPWLNLINTSKPQIPFNSVYF